MTSFLFTQLRRRRSAVAFLLYAQRRSPCCTAAASVSRVDGEERGVAGDGKGRWLTLPPFTPSVDAASLGKKISRGRRPSESACAPTTALKWVRRCCPHLPVSLVQKLFRLRQVRREMTNMGNASCLKKLEPNRSLKRVSGREPMKYGDVILLPVTVQEVLQEKTDYHFNEDERNYIRSLELYKDEAVIAVNKPPGMPVQGGAGIKLSMDMLAGSCLRSDYQESPRLVHRLDRECSGILVLGRTQTSASVLHSVFREKTHGAYDERRNDVGILIKRYWALVIGTPKHSKGSITAPLRKVVLENGKSERIMVTNNEGDASSQHAVTEYRVVGSIHGLAWLELCPLTGRKHQLRVHCAEVLGTPVVGDFKYGWSGHRKWRPLSPPDSTRKMENVSNISSIFGLDLEGGSIMDQKPRLHLHCRQMILPNISVLMQLTQSSTACHDFSNLERLELVAPLPLHMQKSWDALNYSTETIKTSGNTLAE